MSEQRLFGIEIVFQVFIGNHAVQVVVARATDPDQTRCHLFPGTLLSNTFVAVSTAGNQMVFCEREFFSQTHFAGPSHQATNCGSSKLFVNLNKTACRHCKV